MTTTTLAPPRTATIHAIDVQDLTKTYGGRTVVDRMSLRVPAGAVAGFVGPNGAGKTTTLRMLLGLVRPTAGTGTVLGLPLDRPRDYLPRVGALIESPAFYPTLSGARNLHGLAVLGGHDPAQVAAVLERVGLAARGADPFRTYSFGMKQRLGIAAALLPDPDLLILDEPSNGLDPAGIRDMRDLLRDIAADGPTILVSSHLLAEVEQVCDWLVVVEAGRQAYQGRTADLLRGGPTVRLRPGDPASIDALADLFAEHAPERDGGTVRLHLDATAADLAALNRTAMTAGITLAEITPERITLEDRYASLVTGGVR